MRSRGAVIRREELRTVAATFIELADHLDAETEPEADDGGSV